MLPSQEAAAALGSMLIALFTLSAPKTALRALTIEVFASIVTHGA